MNSQSPASTLNPRPEHTSQDMMQLIKNDFNYGVILQKNVEYVLDNCNSDFAKAFALCAIKFQHEGHRNVTIA